VWCESPDFRPRGRAWYYPNPMNRKRIREALMAEGYSPTHCGICDHRLEPDPPELFTRKIGMRKYQYRQSITEHDHWSGFCRGFVCDQCNKAIARQSFPDIMAHFKSGTRFVPGAIEQFLGTDRQMSPRMRAFVSQQSSEKYQ